MQTYKPKSINIPGQENEGPLPKEFKEQIQASIDRMNKIREELMEIMKKYEVKPVEMFRIGSELQATGLERYGSEIGEFVEEKIKK